MSDIYLTQLLNILGLDPKAGNIYIASLQLGQSPVQEIAKKANLPRSTTYLHLETLKDRGLVSEVIIGNKTYIEAVDPSKVGSIIATKKQELEYALTVLPQLHALHQNQSGKPNVRFFQGFEGIKTILEETLRATEILVLCSGYQIKIEPMLDIYMEQYFQNIISLGIRTKELIGGSPDSKKYQNDYHSQNNQIKLTQSSPKLDHIDKLIYDNKVATISYEHLNGVVIENQAIADYERYIFYLLWEKTPRQNSERGHNKI